MTAPTIAIAAAASSAPCPSRSMSRAPSSRCSGALIYELARAALLEAWVTPAILEEYSDVLSDHPEFVAEIVENFPVCYR